MKILMVTGEYPPMQGGVGDYTRRISQALLTLGHEVHVLTSEKAATGTKPPADVDEPLVHPIVPRWDWTALSLVWRKVQEIRPDVLHIQYQTAAYALHPAVNFLPWWVKKRGGAKAPRVVVTFHDIRVPYLFPKAGLLRGWVTRFMARASDAFSVTNEEDFQTVLRHRWRRPPQLIPIGSNIIPSPPEGYSREAQRARWGFAPDAVVICYFGFLNESKGGETLIRVLDTLVGKGYNSHLLMIGGKVGSSDPTNMAYARHIDRLIESLGLVDRVQWTGFTRDEEVSANFLAADICLLPYRDGVSFRRGSFMAALAHGRAIVSTEPRVSIPELREGENVALAPADDVSALVARVEELIQNPERRRTLENGARELSRMFGWDAIARRTEEVYRGLEAR